MQKMREGCHVVVGTPGRVQDLINRECFNTLGLKMLVIDEADEMLSFGFLEQVDEIIKMVPPDCQICLFSATIPNKIITLTNDIMNNPAKILVKKEEIILEGIK